METCIHTAAFYGDVRELSRALSSGQSPTELHLGLSPLHLAAANGHTRFLEILLDQGQNVNEVDQMGCTAVHHAARNGHLATLKWLIENGGDVHVKTSKGRTALELARQQGREGMRDTISFLKKLAGTMNDWVNA